MDNKSELWSSIEQEALEAQERIYIKTRMKIDKAAFQVKLRMWQYIAAASVALLLIVEGTGFLKTNASNQVWVESKCPVGTTTKLTLSDGTTVELNAGSSISYPLSFQGKTRKVDLDGEAYFEVAEDNKHPFIVDVNNVKIRVLGTHFNVKSYADNNRIITTLLKGSVSVEVNDPDNPAGKEITLIPNQQAIFDKTTNDLSMKRVDADLYASWKDGQCFFENERFIDVAKMLERHFGIIVTIKSPHLENQLYSGFFTKKEGILQILNSFKKNRNFDYRQTDDGIEIYERYKPKLNH